MLGEGHLRSIVKENLRSMRFLARELKGTVQSADRHNRWLPRPAVSLTNTVAELSDSALSQIEAAALGFLSVDPQARTGMRAPRHLASYFPSSALRPDAGRETLFARDQYAAAKRVLSQRGAINPSVSEMAFAQAYRQVATSRGHHATGETYLLAVEVTLAIAAVRPVASPVQLIENETAKARDANLFVAAALGLGLAVASLSDEAVPASEVHHAAAAAVDIGWDAVEAAFKNKAQAGDEIERLFREWAPRLP